MSKLKIPKKWYLTAKTFKCDREGCGYTEERGDNPIESYWHKPCPVCGADLLNDIDFEYLLMLNKIMGNPIIRFLNWFGKKTGQPVTKMTLKTDGTGKIEISGMEEVK
jgi:hypothetical protein